MFGEFDVTYAWYLASGALVVGLYFVARRGRRIRRSEQRHRLGETNKLSSGGFRPYLQKIATPASRRLRWRDSAGLILALAPLAIASLLLFIAFDTRDWVYPLPIAAWIALGYLKLPQLLDDERRPITYLRSFKSDTIRPHSVGDWLRVTFGQRPEGDEGALSRCLASAGPLVAVGEPGEFIPPFGSYRVYADHERWRDVVAILVKESQLVVLRPGPTDGLLWELKFLTANVNPERILIFVPQADEGTHYAKFRVDLSNLLSLQLPEMLSGSRFIAFDKHWKPVLLQTTFAGRARSILQGSSAPALHSALQPVAARIGLANGFSTSRFERTVLAHALAILIGLGWYLWSLPAP